MSRHLEIDGRTIAIINDMQRLAGSVAGLEEGFSRSQIRQLVIWHFGRDCPSRHNFNMTHLMDENVLSFRPATRKVSMGRGLRGRDYNITHWPVRPPFPEELARRMVNEANLNRDFERTLLELQQDSGFAPSGRRVGSVTEVRPHATVLGTSRKKRKS